MAHRFVLNLESWEILWMGKKPAPVFIGGLSHYILIIYRGSWSPILTSWVSWILSTESLHLKLSLRAFSAWENDIHTLSLHNTSSGWWFGTWILFSIIYGIILPIDFRIFQRGRYITNQSLYTAYSKSFSHDLQCHERFFETPGGSLQWGNLW